MGAAEVPRKGHYRATWQQRVTACTYSGPKIKEVTCEAFSATTEATRERSYAEQRVTEA